MQDYNEDIVIEQLQNPATVRQAFARVVARYSEPLYWQIRKMVLSHDDANDLLQNTFLKAWGSIEYFRGDAKLSTWLYRIAVNEALTFLARERERRNLTADDTDDFLLSHVETNISTEIVHRGFCKRRFCNFRRNNASFLICAISTK